MLLNSTIVLCKSSRIRNKVNVFSAHAQLFCNLKEDDGITFLENFSTFPFAFMSMFQVLTQVNATGQYLFFLVHTVHNVHNNLCPQEAWPEVMSKTMRLAPHQLTPLVSFFVLFSF